MKGIAIVFFCAFALALSDDDVELNANGCPVDFEVHKVLEHDTYCNLFYTCNNGQREELRCPGDLVFNPKYDVCDWRLNVDCGDKGIFEFVPEEEEEIVGNPGGNNDPSAAPQICAQPNSDGVLVAHENCDEFYKCETYSPVAVQCPDGLLYNSENGYCDWPVNVECGERLIPTPAEIKLAVVKTKQLTPNEACAQDKDNELLLSHENCNQFYKCSYGSAVALFCPPGLVYNAEHNWCDWPDSVDCAGKPIVEQEIVDEDADKNEESGGNGHSDPSQAPAICAAEKSEGVLVAHEKCNQFYKCSHGLPVALDCPLNLLYHSEFEICDWPQNVDCGDRTKSFKKR